MQRMLSLLMAVSVVGLVGCAHTRGIESSKKSDHDWPKAAESPVPYCPMSEPIFRDILFGFDSTYLSGEGIAIANEMSLHLKKWFLDTLLIEGHTCDIGTSDYNLALGAKRALAVRDYLIRQGIDESRITITSYGEEEPAVNNDSESNRRLNRRDVLILSTGDYREGKIVE